MQAWVSCSGSRTTSCASHALGGDQRGSDLRHGTTRGCRESGDAVAFAENELRDSSTRGAVQVDTLSNIYPECGGGGSNTIRAVRAEWTLMCCAEDRGHAAL